MIKHGSQELIVLSCELLAEFSRSDRLSVSANKNVLTLGNRNIGKIPYRCITTDNLKCIYFGDDIISYIPTM